MERTKIIVLKRLKEDEFKNQRQPRPPKGQPKPKKSIRQVKEEEVEEENIAAYEGTAQVRFELSGRDYRSMSMTLDAAGSWVSTPKDIALFAKTFDEPESCPILKPESVEVLFSRRGVTVDPAEEGKEEKEEKSKPVESKAKLSKPYFSSGWDRLRTCGGNSRSFGSPCSSNRSAVPRE